MNRRIPWALGAVCLILLAAPAVAVDDLSQRIDDFIQKMHEADRFNGALLVARGDEVIFRKGFGLADRAFGIANAPNTRFLVGSVSKQFTSMLILQLVQEGKIDLDASPRRYLPDLPADKGDITIHQLLNHTSGLPHYNGLELGVDLDDYLRLDRPVSELVELIGRMTLRSAPGEEYRYSSMGYILLGYIAEQVSGKGFDTLIQERIAGPLGLKGTGFAYASRIVDRLARGYSCGWILLPGDRFEFGYENEPYRDQSNKYCTGGVHSTVEDLFVWARALMTDKLLPDELRRRMFTPGQGNYGYGWRIQSGDEWGELDTEVEVISHAGTLDGYRANIAIIDRGAYTIAILNNTGRGWTRRAAAGVANLLYGEQPGPYDVLSVATAIVMARDGIEAGRRFYRQIEADGFAGYNTSVRGYYSIAAILRELNRPAEALALAELGIESHPNDGNLFVSQAESYRELKHDEDAEQSYRKALALCDSHPEINEGVREQAQEGLDQLAAAPHSVR